MNESYMFYHRHLQTSTQASAMLSEPASDDIYGNLGDAAATHKPAAAKPVCRGWTPVSSGGFT